MRLFNKKTKGFIMRKGWILLIIMLALFLTPACFAAQHDYNIANGPGATVRADINNAYSAVATNNSAATGPATTFANMWWFDSSTNILKIRDNANTAWVNVASKSGTTWTPYWQGVLATIVSTKDFADQAEAEAGTDNVTVMTPLRAKQAIDELQLFKEAASQVEAEAGTENTKGMTALRVKQAIDELTPPADAALYPFEASATFSASTNVAIPAVIAEGEVVRIVVVGSTATGLWKPALRVDGASTNNYDWVVEGYGAESGSFTAIDDSGAGQSHIRLLGETGAGLDFASGCRFILTMDVYGSDTDTWIKWSLGVSISGANTMYTVTGMGNYRAGLPATGINFYRIDGTGTISGRYFTTILSTS